MVMIFSFSDVVLSFRNVLITSSIETFIESIENRNFTLQCDKKLGEKISIVENIRFYLPKTPC